MGDGTLRSQQQDHAKKIIVKESAATALSGARLNVRVADTLRLRVAAMTVIRYASGLEIQGVAITRCNSTGPPCSVGRPTDHAPGGLTLPARRQRYGRRQTTTTDASKQNNNDPLGGQVIICDLKHPLSTAKNDFNLCSL